VLTTGSLSENHKGIEGIGAISASGAISTWQIKPVTNFANNIAIANLELPGVANEARTSAPSIEPAADIVVKPPTRAAESKPVTSPPTAEPKQPDEQQLAMVAPTPTREPEKRRVLVLAWGMPHDENRAPADQVARYSQQLAETLAEGLPQLWGQPVEASIRVPDGRQLRRLRNQGDDFEASSTACAATGVDVVAFVSLEANYINPGMGYGSWREPVYSIYDCRGQNGGRSRGHVTEKRGETLTYASAVTLEFAALVRKALPQ
jgi:hypothetical protein